MMVALHTAVHDGIVALSCDSFFGNRGIDPFGPSPVLCGYLTPLHWCAGVIQDGLLECLIEDSIVEEDIGVVVPPIEMSLY